MWNFLKADLQELVAVVKEDAASLGIPVVEGNVDSGNPNTGSHENQHLVGGINLYITDTMNNTGKTPAEEEAERRMNIPETFTVPLLPRKATNRSSSNKNDTEKMEDEIHKEDLDSEPTINESSDQEKESTNEDAAVDGVDENFNVGKEGDADAADDEDDNIEMDEYEIQQIEEYIKAFDLNDEQTQQDIAYLLEEYKQTLRIQYETLVPNLVTHEEFWERYFYRCDVSRIEMEWERDDEQQEQQQQQQQQSRDTGRTGTKMVTSVTSFLGDAARAVATGMSNALTEDLQSYDDNEEEDDDDDTATDRKEISSTARGLATSIFGHATSSTHRPPFVMNTAVDEDDGEEEEEIGWDDDDDDDDEEEEQIVFDDNTGGTVLSSKHQRSTTESELQVNPFNTKNNEALLLCEQLKEQLKQAIEERDILHQTVSLQTKEITSLRSVPATDQNETVTSNTQNDVIPSDPTNANDKDGNVQMLQHQNQELNQVVRDLEQQILEMKTQYEADRTVLQERVDELQAMNDQLQQQIQELEHKTSIERNEMIETSKRLEAAKVELQAQLQTSQSDVVASQTKILDLQSELETTQEQLLLANARTPVATCAAISTDVGIDDNIVTDATTNMSSSGELTSSTGVKVTLPSPPPPTVVSKIPISSNNEEEEEEGWGDDWD